MAYVYDIMALAIMALVGLIGYINGYKHGAEHGKDPYYDEETGA